MSLTRACAAKMLAEVFKGFTLPSDPPWQLLVESDRAFVKALCMETLRYLPKLEIYLNQLLEKTLPKKETLLKALLLIGLCQLDILGTSPHAAISETVNAAATLKKSWAKSLINAVLRRFQREQAALQTSAEKTLSGKYLHPNWWIIKMQDQYPHHWENILNENNVEPPLFIRVNLQKTSREHYLNLLKEKNIEGRIFSQNEAGIILNESLPVSELPHFSEGWASIQDGAAQCVFNFLQLESGLRLLDACAAPGGKLLHLLESGLAFKKLVALDLSASRLEKLKRNCERINLFPCEFHAVDARAISAWWNGDYFDRIILDAPCSGSGVVRRHPDIKYLKQEKDLLTYAQVQKELLQSVFSTLAPGGLLIYSTCSVFKEENEDVIQSFLANEKTARLEPLSSEVGLKQPFGIQILPGTTEMDGFYYSGLRKCSL